MTTILAHMGGTRKYRSILRHLYKELPKAVHADNLHNKIFDISYVKKPSILLFPISEYTQEIHTFISEKHRSIKPLIVIDKQVSQIEILGFLDREASSKFIIDSQTKYTLPSSISYEYLYDDLIFHKLDNIDRNNKIAVSLSADNEKNHKYLDQHLFPTNSRIPGLVLFNNPEFKHPQNIGIYNEPDLNFILNTYSYYVDMDDDFGIEAEACQIKQINKEQALDECIKNQSWDTKYSGHNFEEYKCSSFISNKLLPFLGLK
jgi:hypothetical protein